MDQSAVRLFIHFKIKPGQVESFRRLAENLTADTLASEPRTQSYEWYLSADQTECWISERFLDSPAYLLHGDHVAERFKLLTQLADVEQFLALGSPDAEMRARLTAAGVQVLEPFSGFSR